MSNQNEPQQQPRSIIPPGTYKVKAIDHVFGRAGTGTEQIGVSLEVVEGPHTGQILNWYGFFTEATEERTIKSMRYLGWKGTAVSKMETMYEGRAHAVVEHDEDQNGVVRAKVQWINAIGVNMKDQMNPAELMSFGKRIAGLAARIDGGGSASGSANGAAPPPGRRDPRDSDPPFPTDDDAPPRQRTRYER